MPFIGLSILVQIICAVHCVRGGRNSMWLWVIIGLSIPGCLAYAFFEIFPYYRANRQVRAVQAAAIRKLDPDREVRVARDALDLADTAAHRIALADALVELGSHREAIEHYRSALAKAPTADRPTQFKLARAELDAGNPREARKLLEQLPESSSPSENDRVRLLLARALQECGDSERALDYYQDLGHRLPGGEAHCRRAALLMELGRPGSQAALEDVERLVKRLDRFERNQQKDMYGWAARTLDELRGPEGSATWLMGIMKILPAITMLGMALAVAEAKMPSPPANDGCFEFVGYIELAGDESIVVTYYPPVSAKLRIKPYERAYASYFAMLDKDHPQERKYLLKLDGTVSMQDDRSLRIAWQRGTKRQSVPEIRIETLNPGVAGYDAMIDRVHGIMPGESKGIPARAPRCKSPNS